MTRGIDARINRAVSMAADRILAGELPPPPSVSPREACAEVGVGMTRFYRVFGSAEEYRRQLAVHHLRSRLEDFAARSVKWTDATQWAVSNRPLSDDEIEIGFRIWAASLWEEIVRLAVELGMTSPIEAEYLPWSSEPTIRAAIAESFLGDRDRYAKAVESAVAASRRTPLLSATSIVDYFTFSATGILLLGAAAGDAGRILAELHAALAVVLYPASEA